MDPPPLLPSQPTTTTQLNHPDSATSSPRTHHTTTTSDDPLPPVPNAKLRVMCSYGGHIIPRPHDKSLCYVGGDTRMVALDRHSSLTSLSSRLSRTLFHGRSFTLKYQLPNEDLDSLISVGTDEDLDNMFEEYDRITTSVSSSSSSKGGRIRLFLFLAKPETAASMGSLLDDAKSETWFVDALNGTGFDLPRGLSDSATMDCLVEIDDEGEDGVVHIDSRPELDSDNNKGKNNNAHNVVSIMPDSPLVETNSSFESSSSSPMMSNLPPIKVRIEGGGGDQMVGLDEQFLQMNVAQPPPLPTGVGGGVQVVGVDEQFLHMNVAQPQPLGTVIGGGVQVVGLDEQFLHMNVAMPPLPTVIGGGGAVVSGGGPGGANAAAVFDDERLDQGAPTGFRKPPLPLQPVPRKVVDACGLLSPDSVASDSSIASATQSKHAVYQEPTHLATSEIRTPAFPIEPKSNTPDASSQQLHDSAYMLPPQQIQQQQQQQQQQQLQQQQQQQQQFVYTNQHYIHHPVTGQQMPISSYYQMYAPPPSQQQHHDHHQMDQQYPMYFHPVTQTMPSNSTVGLSAVYNEPNPSIYLTKTGTPEMPGNANRNPAMATPLPVQVSSNQFHQQYMGTVPQMHHHPSQTMAANYGFEYPHQTHEQVYYAQHPAAPMPSQYQTMNPATAAFLSQAAAQQLPSDTTQQIRNTQPL